MKTATFQNSVDVLVKAFMNDTLQHCNCSACAVGNLISAANGYSIHRDVIGQIRWEGVQRHWFMDRNSPDATNQIESTGYSEEEIFQIERAFEGENRFYHPERAEDENIFNGLLAVVEVLAQIHSVDLSTKETAVSRFHSVQESKEI